MNDLQRLIMGLQIEKPMGGDTLIRSDRISKETFNSLVGTAKTSPGATSYSSAAASTTLSATTMKEMVDAMNAAGLSPGGRREDYETTPAPSFFDTERDRTARRRRAIADATQQAVTRSIEKIQEMYPHLMGSQRGIYASGERLVEILNVANYHRHQFGYERHRAYQEHLEGMARNWSLNDHLNLMEHAKGVPLPGAPAKEVVSDAPDALSRELEATLLREAERSFGGAARGGW